MENKLIMVETFIYGKTKPNKRKFEHDTEDELDEDVGAYCGDED